MPHTYPLLNVEIRTPKLALLGASDDLLERLEVAAGYLARTRTE